MRLHLSSALAGLAALALVTPSFARSQPAEAVVICKDGSTAKAGRGACRGHGGVDKAATRKAAGGAAAAAGEERGKKASGAMAQGEAKAGEKTAGMMVTCKDGTTAKAGRGACRGHGGVDKAAMAKAGAAASPAPMPPMPAEPAPQPRAPAAPQAATPAAPATPPMTHPAKAPEGKGPPTARCKDGTFSYAEHHTGACSNHGGVAEWLDKK